MRELISVYKIAISNLVDYSLDYSVDHDNVVAFAAATDLALEKLYSKLEETSFVFEDGDYVYVLSNVAADLYLFDTLHLPSSLAPSVNATISINDDNY